MSSFGKYRLLAQIGEGGMAEVFLAVVAGPRGSGFSKLTVIKRLRANLADDPEFIDMLVDEARIAARLNHPNVVQTHEVGDVDGKYYLAMEYLDGQSLNRIQNLSMARNRKAAQDPSLSPSPLTKEMQYVVLLDVLAGLHHAHELTDYDGTAVQIVHRDVTPQNVFVMYEGQAKVVDFGIAKAVGRAAETRHGVVKGKARYMAPEQALGGDIDRRADIFSVGALLWESAAGARRWKDQSEAEIVRALLSDGGYSPVRAVDPSVPEEIEAMCKKALSPDPNDRFQTADEFRKALEAYLVSTGKLVEARSALGAAVGELCKDSRAELKAVIEKQLKNLASAESTGDSAPLRLTFQPRESDRSSRRELSLSSVPPTANATDAGVGMTNMTPVKTPTSRKGIVLGAVGVAVLLAIGAVALRPKGGDGRAAAKAVTTETASPVATEVAISITATPKNAQIFVDGKPVGSPYEAKVAKSSGQHTVRVEAEGYEAQTQTVAFERDITLAVALAKAVVTAPSAVRSSTPTAAGAAPVAWTPPKATSKATATPAETSNPAPRETASAPPSPASVAAATATPTARKKDIDRSNPFTGASSGAGPAKNIDKSNPFGN
ncbi:MAG: protein kinase [Deltaproteobacteria bacterium]|nr:protein kinase [Deltaproteobacteria bacterium]